jgi:hypothetical protein
MLQFNCGFTPFINPIASNKLGCWVFLKKLRGINFNSMGLFVLLAGFMVPVITTAFRSPEAVTGGTQPC